ncbi:unnamed protein product [Anisakis simplex]|uniref:Fasciclin-2 (inferred by orthology to a D. melanogaster protein) n=1 Tax=Anisakis simplex TaxID=6269 RepID=A0A0M3JXV7_ANISI|nr:unnamed protein product [Anisakis simplex]
MGLENLLKINVVLAWNMHTFPSDEQLLNRKSGENLMVVCSLKGFVFSDSQADVQIEWYKEGRARAIGRMGRVMTLSKGKALSKQLMFVKPAVEDSGLYSCVAKTFDGEVKQKSVNITFISKILFINDIESKVLFENGGSIIIICIKRHIDHLLFGLGGPRGYELRDNNQMLFIPKFESEHDDGEYQCNAAQFASFETLSINVTAYAPPQITVFDGPTAGRAYEGRTAQFQCQAVGKPKPNYKWLRKTDGGKEEEIVATDKYSVDGGLLLVHSLIANDAGVYSCIATNTLDSQRLDFNLSIFRKPKIGKMENVTRERNDVVELRCAFSGDGRIDAKWLHQGVEWSERITTAGNALDVTALASFEAGDSDDSENETYSFDEDDDGVAEHHIEDDDQIIADYGRRKRQDDSRISVRREQNALVLRLEMVGEDDAGVYQCVAENEAGVDRRSTFLAITHEPTITAHSDQQRVLIGSEVMLWCEASAVPDPTWTWNGPNGLIEADGTKTLIHSEASITKLTITSTSGTDYGNYVCSAENGIGSAVRAVIEVVQIFVPDTPTEVNCHAHIYPNFATCKVNGFNKADQGHRPTRYVFYLSRDTEVDSAFDWQKQARNVSMPFSVDAEMRIADLEPKSRYTVRVKALNEAGESALSETDFIETTDPWAPETPQVIHADCLRVCSLAWRPPNDHGSPIHSYRVFIREVLNKHPRELANDMSEIQLSGDERSVELSLLKPLTEYEVRLIAVNDVGNSHPFTTVLKTPEYSLSDEYKMNTSSTRLIVLAGFVLLFVLMVIDVICFAMNRCGLIACFCINCLGRNIHSTKGKGVEQNTKSSESNRLLNDGKLESGVLSRDEGKVADGGGTGPQSTSV